MLPRAVTRVGLLATFDSPKSYQELLERLGLQPRGRPNAKTPNIHKLLLSITLSPWLSKPWARYVQRAWTLYHHWDVFSAQCDARETSYFFSSYHSRSRGSMWWHSAVPSRH